MPLQEEDFAQITAHVKAHLGEWVIEQRLGKPLEVYEIELRERTLRVEEELKHQRELMQQGFAQVDRRFEQMDQRFEQMDQRFEQMDQRFEQMERHFGEFREDMNRRFEQMTRRIDRFMIGSFGITVTAAGTVIAVLKVWP